VAGGAVEGIGGVRLRPSDPSIPDEPPSRLFRRRGKDIALVKKVDDVPELMCGDLVIYVQPRETEELNTSLLLDLQYGIIVAKIKLTYDFDHDGWVIERA
jgi:hypothetical protein